MNKTAILGLLVLAFTGCNQTTQQSINTNASTAQVSDNSPLVSGHSQSSPHDSSAAPHTSATVIPKSEAKTKWTQSGTPIDTSALDAEVVKTEKDFKAKSKDEAAKKSLADAYLKRGVALTEVGQYASALGDYRRALKYDPNSAEAKTWIGKIIDIYQMINREPPKEGEEPPALPFKKAV